MKSLKAVLVQNGAGASKAVNFARLCELLEPVASCDIICLPEVCLFRGCDQGSRRYAEPIPGSDTQMMSTLAKAKNSWLLAGSLIEKDGDKIYNTSVLFDRKGEIQATYRKIHLFEAYLEGASICESKTYSHGEKLAVADIEGWRCGLSICYDLRFPELYRKYAEAGCDLIFAPANFTHATGVDHWEVLCRSRAIENQCFLLAPGQVGLNEANGVLFYGNSLALDPWGRILLRGGAEEEVLEVTLDRGRLDETRTQVPALRNRRPQIFQADSSTKKV